MKNYNLYYLEGSPDTVIVEIFSGQPIEMASVQSKLIEDGYVICCILDDKHFKAQKVEVL